MITPVSQHRVVLSTPQTLAPQPSLCTPPSAPKPAPPAFPRLHAHLTCLAPYPWLCLTPLLLRSLKLVLYRTLEHSATAPAKAHACVAGLAATLHIVELVTSLTVPAYPFSHGPSFNLALRLALLSMLGLVTFKLPASDADLLSAASLTVTRLAAYGFGFFDQFLATRLQVALPTSPSQTSSACSQAQVKCPPWSFPISLG